MERTKYGFLISNEGLKRLHSVDDKLGAVILEAHKRSPFDFSINEGARSIAEARKNFLSGASKLDPDKGQFSKHIIGKEVGRDKSIAVDIVPYDKSLGGKLWGKEGERRMDFIAGIIYAVADEMNIKIRWGGAWDLNHKSQFNTKDQLMDSWHFELI